MDKKIDVLAWWKANSERFPALSLMAKDVLAMPISTVASESAFNTGGRILDDFRSSLSPATVEALICSQDWIRGDASARPPLVEEDPEEADKIDDELSKLMNAIAIRESLLSSNSTSTTGAFGDSSDFTSNP